MLKKENIIYLTDKYLYMYSSKKNKKYKFKMDEGIILTGKIANYQKFIKRYFEILKEQKVNNSFIGEKLHLIVNHNYTDVDRFIIQKIFLYFNYRNIKIDDDINYYKLNNNNVWLNLQDKYFTIYFYNKYGEKEYFLIKNNEFKNNNDLNKYIKYLVDAKDLFLIGDDNKVREMYYSFEKKFSNITYTFSNNEFYLIDKCLKKIEV